MGVVVKKLDVLLFKQKSIVHDCEEDGVEVRFEKLVALFV